MGLFGSKNKKRLPDSKINEGTVLEVLMNGAPFIITFPITQLAQTSNGNGSSVRVGFYTQTYSPSKTEMRFRKVSTTIKYDYDGITINHAMPNGQHVIVNPKAIVKIRKYDYGVAAELNDDTTYVFEMDEKIQNFWKEYGFDPAMPINVFYNIILGKLPKQLQNQFEKETEIQRQAAQKQAFQQAMIKRHEEMDKRAEQNRIKREEEKQLQKQIEEKEKLEKQKEREKIEQEALERKQKILMEKNIQRTKLFDEFAVKIKTLKETFDLDAISHEEYDEIKSTFLNQVFSSQIPDDIDSLVKLKESKELLDIGAITQEEFDKLKSKFLNNGADFKFYTSSNDDNRNRLLMKKHGGKVCPYCGEQIPNNAIRCKYCKTMLKSYSGESNVSSTIDKANRKNDFIYKSSKNDDRCGKLLMEKHGGKVCPYCGEQIPINAIRCKYCKTMLKSYSGESNVSSTIIVKVNHENEKTSTDDNPSDVQLLDEDVKKRIEDNIEDVCRIFSIANLGKDFVINKLTNDFTQEEISNKLNKYLDNSQKESSISKKIAHKRKLIENNIKPIPEQHFKLYFLIHESSFRSKDRFINHIQTYWSINDINRFYERYTSLLENGIQKIHFEKILKYYFEDTCKMFSVSKSMRMFGVSYVIDKILNNHSENEIKEKLNSHFNLATEYLNEIDTTDYEAEEEKVTISSKPNYYNYKVQVNSLKSKFIKKEQNVRELVEKCFPAPQLTNTKFISMIDECSRVFNQNIESTLLIIESTNKYSDKLENQLKSEIEILKEFNIKLDLLRDELLIIYSENDNPDADMLFNDMDNLIDSVNNYKDI